MATFYGQDFGQCKTAKDIITLYPRVSGSDGYYFIYPNGRNSPGQLVYCDMTTDGGGWMLIARSHPSTINYGSTNWGWTGNTIGNVKDFSQAYQAGWGSIWHSTSATFSSFIYGNRNNINDNTWGYFIYKGNINYTNLLTSDTQQSFVSTTTLKSNTAVYGSTSFPGMQGQIGYPTTGTTNNNYYMRDCCGYASYGGSPTFMQTTYCGSDVSPYISGPWCGGSNTDGSGNFLSGSSTTAGGRVYGGTNQYMIMVK